MPLLPRFSPDADFPSWKVAFSKLELINFQLGNDPFPAWIIFFPTWKITNRRHGFLNAA
jgi:hypothetical protein